MGDSAKTVKAPKKDKKPSFFKGVKAEFKKISWPDKNKLFIPDEAKAGGAGVVATGRSDYPNQINNVLAFPGVFRGAFDVRAREINEEMKLAAAQAISNLVGDELSAEYIIPSPLDERVVAAVSAAVAQAARDTGVARI